MREALEKADANGCESIVVPAGGCGLGSVPLATGAEVIGKVLVACEPATRSLAYSIALISGRYRTIRRVPGADWGLLFSY